MTPADRLSELLRIPTVSDPAFRDERTFERFRDALGRLYPRVRAELEQVPAEHGALHLVWRGGDAAPVVLLAHHDVVPVQAEAWQRDPFSGGIEGGVVHGRGALDDKGPLVAVLEAVEGLLADGFRPAGDVHLVSGADEEVGGPGAAAVARRLQEQGVRPALVLDEGGAVVEGVVPGVRGPLAMIGLTEKGQALIRLTARAVGGHASVPPRRQAAVGLARALTRIERRPFPARSNAVIVAMAAALGPRLPRAAAVLRAGPASRLVGPLLGALGGVAGALSRTTVAVTLLSAGTATNVLAAQAEAVLDVRIAPGETVTTTTTRLRRTIRDDAIGLEVLRGSDPPPASRPGGPAWRRVVDAAAVAYPEALPVPYLMVQASDARHFTGLGAQVYRFMPFAITAEELAAIHGADERVRIASLEAAIRFHRALLTHA